jgi:hypothetical protein
MHAYRPSTICACTLQGLRALDAGGQPIDPAKVKTYLQKAFKDSLPAATEVSPSVGLGDRRLSPAGSTESSAVVEVSERSHSDDARPFGVENMTVCAGRLAA